MASNKSERSLSPSALSEEGRRDLIARQHRALYGNENASFVPNAGDPSVSGQGPVRGPSPRGMEPFGMPGQGGSPMDAPGQGSLQEQAREKAASPASQQPTVFGNFDVKTSTPPIGEETAHARQLSKSTTAPIAGSMGPIGSRTNMQQAPNQGIKQRTTSPLPSLSYGFTANEQNNERTTSSNSNAAGAKENASNPTLGTWGTGSGVWGNKIGATSVWG